MLAGVSAKTGNEKDNGRERKPSYSYLTLGDSQAWEWVAKYPTKAHQVTMRSFPLQLTLLTSWGEMGGRNAGLGGGWAGASAGRKWQTKMCLVRGYLGDRLS